jgi:DNA invertase Pin-like site-specific DNA recombinase
MYDVRQGKKRRSMMRTAIYGRVSTKDRGQEVENQLVQLREFAAKQGWTVVREYIDHESGPRSDRPEFKQMFQDASQRRFDLVLFWSLDRLSREGVLQTLNYLNRLASHGVGYRSFTEQYFDSCGIFKDAVIAIMATVAKQERIRISERTKAGLEAAKRKGVPLSRRRVRIDGTLVRQLQAEGKSFEQIAKELKCGVGTAFRASKAA